MSRSKNEDTLQFYMRDTREMLAAVSAVIERGRVATSDQQRAIASLGPWCIGTLYSTDVVKIKLYIAVRVDNGPLEVVTLPTKSVYIGLKGAAMLHSDNGYSRIRTGSVANMAAGIQHSLEPVENDTHVLVVEVGEG